MLQQAGFEWTKSVSNSVPIIQKSIYTKARYFTIKISVHDQTNFGKNQYCNESASIRLILIISYFKKIRSSFLFKQLNLI